MSRLFWFGAGVGTAVYATVKLRRTTQRLTPVGIADQVGALGAGARAFADEVRLGMAEREAELREALASSDPGMHPRMLIQARARGQRELA